MNDLAHTITELRHMIITQQTELEKSEAKRKAAIKTIEAYQARHHNNSRVEILNTLKQVIS